MFRMCVGGSEKNNFLVGTLLRIFWGSLKNLFGGGGGLFNVKRGYFSGIFSAIWYFSRVWSKLFIFLGAPSYPICLTFGLQSRWWDRTSF